MSSNVLDNGSLNHYGFTANAMGKRIKNEDMGRMKAVKKSQRLQCQGGLAAVFAGAQAEINFMFSVGTANTLDIIDDITLELNIVNNDAVNAATLLAGNFLVNNFNTLGSNTIEQIYAEHQVIRELFTAENDEYLEQKATISQYSYSYAAGYGSSAVTIAASGSKKVYVQLRTVLDMCKIFLPAISQQISLQLFMDATGMTAASAASSISVTSAYVVLNGFKYEDSVRQLMLKEFAKYPHYYSYNVCQRGNVNSQAVSAASAVSVPLTAFNSYKIPALFLMVRAASASADALYAFDKIGNLDLFIDGTSNYSVPLDNAEFVQMAINDCKIRTSVPGSPTNILMLPHATNVYEALKFNKQRGWREYDPNVSINIQMSSVTGTRDIIYIGFQACLVKIENGQLIVEKL